MARYKVVLKRVADASVEGQRAFVQQYAQACGMTLKDALVQIRQRKNVFYDGDNQATAEKTKRFLESIGGVAKLETSFHMPSQDLSPFAPGGSSAQLLAQTRACPKCGYQVSTGTEECPSCQVYISKYEQMMARKAEADEFPLGGEAPGDASGWAPPAGPSVPLRPAGGMTGTCKEAKQSLIAGIIGIFCCGFAFGVGALVTGHKALELIKENPQLKGKHMAIAGMILGALDILTWIIIVWGQRSRMP